MAKTLGTILEVAGIAALAYITGGTALALANGFSVGVGLGATAGALSGVVGGLALNELNTLIGGPSVPKPGQQEVSIKPPRPWRAGDVDRFAPEPEALR